MISNYFQHAELAYKNKLTQYYFAQLIGVISSLLYYSILYTTSAPGMISLIFGYVIYNLAKYIALNLLQRPTRTYTLSLLKAVKYAHLILRKKPVSLIIGLPAIFTPLVYIYFRNVLIEIDGLIITGSIDAAVNIWIFSFSTISATLVPILVANGKKIQKAVFAKINIILIVLFSILAFVGIKYTTIIISLLYSPEYVISSDILRSLFMLFPLQISIFLYGSELLAHSRYARFFTFEICQLSALILGVALLEDFIQLPFYLSVTAIFTISFADVIFFSNHSKTMKTAYAVLMLYCIILWFT
jgi:hypothetical protein